MKEDKLESLPRKLKFRDSDVERKDSWYGSAYPWKRVRRYLESQAGELWNNVTAKLVKATWIPVEQRNIHHLYTFMRDGEVLFYSGYPRYNSHHTTEGIPVTSQSYRDFLYVHPVSMRLIFQPKTTSFKQSQKDYLEQKKNIFRVLGKLHQYVKYKGIWFEVKAVPLLSVDKNNAYYDRHPLIGEENQSDPRWPFTRDRYSLNFTMNRQLSTRELKEQGLVNDNSVQRYMRRFQ
jgi:hypothetical protein